MLSGRISDDCDKFRAFCAAPSIPSLLKLGVRWVLRAVGDLRELAPFVRAANEGDGTSMLKESLECIGNCLEGFPFAEPGESPVEDGDMMLV
jgi:hypothetical protein